jgi:hypothetical protein
LIRAISNSKKLNIGSQPKIRNRVGNKNKTNIMATNSVTLHQNWGSYAPYDNPNVYPGDINGNPVTPQRGVECHLWAKVQNNGTATAQFVNVSFFLCVPAGNVVWPPSAHGSGSVPSIAVGATQPVMCSIPWIPDTTVSAHQCLVGVASCLDCPAPPTTPGQPVDFNNPQIGQHNLTISLVTVTSDSTARYFNVVDSKNPGYVQITREPLSKHAAALKSRGIDPKIPEAPSGEKLDIKRQSDDKAFGDRMDFKAGEKHELYTIVHCNDIKPGTAAIYHVQHFENNKLIGGVSQIILYK